jgi:hypothetical protein
VIVAGLENGQILLLESQQGGSIEQWQPLSNLEPQYVFMLCRLVFNPLI